jgi:hypothetical protein
VLRDLLGHDSIQTTLGYYRVTEKRVRAAVDRVSAHQFDGQGRRVMLGIRSLLADEHARMRVGQVAVPFGICTEPSNVKAGGHACPYKFTCLGCGHFRSDPSYLQPVGDQVAAPGGRVRLPVGCVACLALCPLAVPTTRIASADAAKIHNNDSRPAPAHDRILSS